MTDIDFDDMAEPAEERPTKYGSARGGVIFLQAAAVNSIELSIRSIIAAEPALYSPVEFLDSDGNVEPKHRAEFDDEIPHTPELAVLRSQIFAHLQQHVSLARSLGEDGSYQQYVAACKREGMTPLSLADYK